MPTPQGHAQTHSSPVRHPFLIPFNLDIPQLNWVPTARKSCIQGSMPTDLTVSGSHPLGEPAGAVGVHRATRVPRSQSSSDRRRTPSAAPSHHRNCSASCGKSTPTKIDHFTRSKKKILYPSLVSDPNTSYVVDIRQHKSTFR